MRDRRASYTCTMLNASGDPQEAWDASALADVGRALADPVRLRILARLMAGDAGVSELAASLDLPQPRVSAQLALLRDAGLVSAAASGRHRTYRVDAPRMGPALAALRALRDDRSTTPPASAEASRLTRRNAPIRQARTCYDHLAGVAGVGLLEALLDRGWLIATGGDAGPTAYRLTTTGERALRDLGVDIAGAAAARRRFAYGCLDWTERRPHLGGALGAALLRALETTGTVDRDPASRAASVRTPLVGWLDGVEPVAADAGGRR